MKNGICRSQLASLWSPPGTMRKSSRMRLSSRAAAVLPSSLKVCEWFDRVRDLISGEEILVDTGLTKDQIKHMKKGRGYKKVPVIKV